LSQPAAAALEEEEQEALVVPVEQAVAAQVEVVEDSVVQAEGAQAW
jgi:hypothetical protein